MRIDASWWTAQEYHRRTRGAHKSRFEVEHARDVEVALRAVDTFVSRLKAKIGDSPRFNSRGEVILPIHTLLMRKIVDTSEALMSWEERIQTVQKGVDDARAQLPPEMAGFLCHETRQGKPVGEILVFLRVEDGSLHQVPSWYLELALLKVGLRTTVGSLATAQLDLRYVKANFLRRYLWKRAMAYSAFNSWDWSGADVLALQQMILIGKVLVPLGILALLV